MKLHEQTRRKVESHSNKRFYTGLDMAIIKKEQEALNSQEKRGLIKRKGNRYIAVCGCGLEGCFVHGSFDSVAKNV